MTTEYLKTLEALPTEINDERPPLSGVATVHLSHQAGRPQHLASGFIYGIPDTPDQIPDHCYSSIGFHYGRGGGSQLPNTRGWYRSKDDYKARFQSALSNYQTARKHGGQFVYLISAIWGADGGQQPEDPYPGDNDDWSSWDKLLSTWIADAQHHDMLEGLVFDIWNEPDLKFFWNRSQEQYLNLWERTYRQLRCDLPSLRISGPSFSCAPHPSSQWWNSYLSHITTTRTIPDQWSWHMEQGDSTPLSTSTSHFRDLLSTNSIPTKSPTPEININEYAVWSEQVPSGAAWFISQLERENAIGLRGNWTMAGALHDFMAGLISKPGAGTEEYEADAGGYYPTAEWHVYKYYGTEMKGDRVRTKPTDDGAGDVYAVLGEDAVRVLAGTRNAKGKWTVEIRDIDQIGLSDGDEVTVKTIEFAATQNHFERNDGPADAKVSRVKCEDGSLRLEIDQLDAKTAYAFEILRKSTPQ